MSRIAWISQYFVTSLDGGDVHACVCRRCGALVHNGFLDVHVKWHEDCGPVKAFQEHWRNGGTKS